VAEFVCPLRWTCWVAWQQPDVSSPSHPLDCDGVSCNAFQTLYSPEEKIRQELQRPCSLVMQKYFMPWKLLVSDQPWSGFACQMSGQDGINNVRYIIAMHSVRFKARRQKEQDRLVQNKQVWCTTLIQYWDHVSKSRCSRNPPDWLNIWCTGHVCHKHTFSYKMDTSTICLRQTCDHQVDACTTCGTVCMRHSIQYSTSSYILFQPNATQVHAMLNPGD